MRLRRWLRRLLIAALLIALTLFVFVRIRMHGPYRDYRVDTSFISAPSSERLMAGVAMRDITPNLDAYDSWVDADQNSKFEPKKGDTYVDRNGDGDFNFVWLGGFSSNRPAQGVNDPLWTRAIALRHGGRTVVMVTLDLVGLTHERFIKIRKAIDHQALGVDHILFSCTHTHNGPDTLGIWSYGYLPFRLDHAYIDLVQTRTEEAIREAVSTLQAVDVTYAMTDVPPEEFVRDSRLPKVYDRQLNAVRFAKAGSSETLATIVSWGNHPEAMGGKNPLVSSDFPHYWRKGVEEGLPEPNGCRGLGGMCLFFQGPVGGLMTPLGITIPDRDDVTRHEENGPGKTKALGENLARLTVDSLTTASAQAMTDATISLTAKTVFVPIDGTYKYPMMLGIIHPGWYNGKAKSEVSALRIGDIEILNIPGEVYPEIVDGGIEAPEGADFALPPQEIPPLRSQMTGKINMVFNLVNDEVGYIIPKSQWDADAPYAYGLDEAPYGEVNSGGPDVGLLLHRESMEVLKNLHALTLSGP